ncbi:MAG: RNA polymerase sigma factor [Gammaproteobacteria bacterium]
MSIRELEQLEDEQLVARSSDARLRSSCLACLYERHLHRVVGWCLRVSGNQQDALDIAQEVFIRVENKLDSFRTDSRFTTWLYVITRRAAIDHLRRQTSQADRAEAFAREPAVESETPEALAQTAEVADRLQEDLNHLLVPEEAQVIYMHFSLGMTLPAITRTLGLTNSSGAKAPLVAAMRKLRRHYNVVAGATRSTQ